MATPGRRFAWLLGLRAPPSIATQYDAFHADHPLLALDQALIAQVAEEVRNKRTDIAKEPPVVIDLGCGTGRSILPLAQNGWKAIGVDLSQHMLDEAARKADSLRLGDQISWLQSNIVELDRLENNSADLVLCMYSSIGMIQGTKNRQQLFDHVRRILRHKEDSSSTRTTAALGFEFLMACE